MVTLIKKDLKLMLINKAGVVFVLFGLPLLFYILASDRFFSNVVIIYLLTCLTSVLSYDYEKKEDSQKIFLSLPVTRKHIVYSKYIMIPVYFIFYVIFINLYSKALSLVNLGGSITSLQENIWLFLVISLILGITMPMYFSFSTNVARGISYFIIIFTNNIYVSGENVLGGKLFTYLGGFWVVVLATFILLASMGVSIIVYNEAEF